MGKTTLIRQLYAEFEGRVSTLSLDNYYLPKEKQIRDQKGIINFDLPTALDTDQLKADLNSLIAGNNVEHEVYRFNNPEAPVRTNLIQPNELLIVEGLFVMHYPFVREKLNYSVFLSVNPDIQLERRLHRDMRERNYSYEDVMYQWNNHVLPSFSAFVEPYQKEADLIITNNERFDENIHTLMAVIHANIDPGQ